MKKSVAYLWAFVFSITFGCSFDQPHSNEGIEGCMTALSDNFDPTATIDNGSCLPFDCKKCNYVVPANKYEIDGIKLGIKPGDFICLDAAIKYPVLKFVNLKGAVDNPITVVNCGGQVKIDAAGLPVCIRVSNSQFFRISGVKDNENYGIVLSGAKTVGLTLEYLSTNFEVDNIEVYDVGFAGIMAKTDPSCDDATIRGNFTMRDVSFHNNYVHDTGGEGFYIGNSFYANGVTTTTCGVRYPHDIVGVKVYKNKVENSGWESIQVGSAPQGAEIYSNLIENYGVANVAVQNNGIQLGEGTGGLCYNNVVLKGNGVGIIVVGLGDNVVYNNLIVEAGSHGIFCDERYTPGPGFKFINNTIVSPKGDGIRIYADLVPLNVITNNLIVNPGTYDDYSSLSYKSASDSYIYKLSNNVKLDMSNNYFTRKIDDVKFTNAASFDFSLTGKSPAIDQGRDVSNFNVNIDLTNAKRPNMKAFDVGAFEYYSN